MSEVWKQLSGRQHVTEGTVMPDDLCVHDGKCWPATSSDFCRPIEYMAPVRIYRVMPVAKQGDTGRDWQKVQEDLRREVALVERFEGLEAAPAKALTFDDGKPPLAYLPWAGVDAVARVQAYGQRKYGDFYNYRKGMEVGRNLSCVLRHVRSYMEGEDVDPESKESHLAHAACRLLFVLQNLHDKRAIDDRYKHPTEKSA